MNTDDILAVISDFPDPETGRAISKTEQIKNIDCSGDVPRVQIGLTSHSGAISDEIGQKLTDRIVSRLPGIEPIVEIVEHQRMPARLGQIGLRVKSVIAVGSGKGGVGKSTVAASLAACLQRFGSSVGLMDADVYGPSIPHLLGLSGRPVVGDTNESSRSRKVRYR